MPKTKKLPGKTARKTAKRSALSTRAAKPQSATKAVKQLPSRGKSYSAKARREVVMPGPADRRVELNVQKVVATLTQQDQALFQKLVGLLESHLGSLQAAQVWLTTESPAFVTTPIAAIREGQANLVLDMLESQWGSSPIYA